MGRVKKKTIASIRKKLQKECLDLAKEICKVRDNNECQLHKWYPHIALSCAGYLQADHCISRACKKYFHDPRNLTWVCGAANQAKHFMNKSADEGIRRIVVEREGQEFYDEMIAWNMSKVAFTDYSNVVWLEEKRQEMECELADLKVGKDIANDRPRARSLT